jgi:hypothetical protein
MTIQEFNKQQITPSAASSIAETGKQEICNTLDKMIKPAPIIQTAAGTLLIWGGLAYLLSSKKNKVHNLVKWSTIGLVVDACAYGVAYSVQQTQCKNPPTTIHGLEGKVESWIWRKLTKKNSIKLGHRPKFNADSGVSRSMQPSDTPTTDSINTPPSMQLKQNGGVVL